MKRSSVPLSTLQAADEATIVEIEGPESARLAGFGLYPGMSVIVRQTFPSFVVKTEETEIAIESDVAERIQVLPPEGLGRGRRRRLQRRGHAGGRRASAASSPHPETGAETKAAEETLRADPGRSGDPPGGFPRRAFVLAVILVCAALTISALHTFFTLRSLRTTYLDNRGHDIAALVANQLRGPGRRFDSVNRQRVLDTTLETYAASITYLALLDRTGRVTAQAGTPGSLSEVRVFETQLGAQRGPRWNPASAGGGETLRIGLRTDQASFIDSQAWLHLAVSLATVLLLAALAVYFLRTLNQFLVLQAREVSERQLAQLGRLSATLAHEIRNPLGAMKGLTQIVQEDLPRDHRANELMSTVVSEAERLEKLVTDLLAFARPRPLSVQSVVVDELVASVALLLQSSATNRGVTIEFDRPKEPLEVRADPDGLRQILLNVIGNALDATPTPGTIDLKLAGRGSTVEILVMDRGPGLGSEDPEELFQPFRTTKTQGSGLGLAVSRQIVERLGGSISLENRPEGGTICRIQLPKRG